MKYYERRLTPSLVPFWNRFKPRMCLVLTMPIEMRTSGETPRPVIITKQTLYALSAKNANPQTRNVNNPNDIFTLRKKAGGYTQSVPKRNLAKIPNEGFSVPGVNYS